MNPIDPGPPGELSVYAEEQPEYYPLITRVTDRNHMIILRTRWQLTDEERRQVAEGADILLDVTTFGQPLQPLSMRLSEEPAPVEAVRDDSGVGWERIGVADPDHYGGSTADDS